jgi:hypothetical protein
MTSQTFCEIRILSLRMGAKDSRYGAYAALLKKCTNCVDLRVDVST